MNWKLNLKLRFKNKATLAALLALAVTFVYQVLGIFDVVPAIGQSDVINIIGIILNMLVFLGVITDPTTDGIADSVLAMTYEEPRKARRESDFVLYKDLLEKILVIEPDKRDAA